MHFKSSQKIILSILMVLLFLTSFVLPLAVVFTVIFTINLNDSEFAKVAFASSL